MKLKNSDFNELQCAFCQSAVPPGATVCAHCGAFHGKNSDYQKGSTVMAIVGVFCVILGMVVVGNGIKSIEYLLWALGLMAGGGILTYVTIIDGVKPVWLRRN